MKSRLLILSLLMTASLHAGTVVVGVDAAEDRHPIDPRIYGVAYATVPQVFDLNVTLNRWGGNATTRYNWQQNASNRAADWYFESIAETGSAAGRAADNFIRDTISGGSQPVITIPTMGWVAKLGANRSTLPSFSVARYGPQEKTDPYLPDAGNGVTTSGTLISANDPNDANLTADAAFQQAWIRHITGIFWPAAQGGVRYYALDNEPSLWHATHRDVHPIGATMVEVRDRMIDYAEHIKDADPDALVMGPEEWGWSGYFYSGYDQQWAATHEGTSYPDRAANRGNDYLPWLLTEIGLYDYAHQRRLLDVLTVHYYPQGGEFSDDVSPAMQLRRNRSTRALWDPNYPDESWIKERVNLIPRLRQWVTAGYPKTKIGITEYNWGAEGHINGATAQADLLGIFGRERLDVAIRWTTPATGSPAYNAIKMYRNYDGARSTFGETSIMVRSANPDNLSAFGAIRSADAALTVMLINKTTTDTEIALNVDHYQLPPSFRRWQLTAENVVEQMEDVTVGGPDGQSTTSLTVPAQSITLLVARPTGVKPPRRHIAHH